MAARRIPVAVQLYSLREVIGEDVKGTLKALAEMGYEGVEFAGTYDLSAEALREMLDDCGLKCAGAHVGLPMLEGDNLAPTVAFYRTLGTDRLIVPGVDLDHLDDTIARLKSVNTRIAAMNARTGFHNHTKEFETVDGETKFDRIFSELAENFLVQLDIGWASAAGQDVPALLRKYRGRIQTVHVKEFDPNDKTAAVGEGTVDWPSVMDVVEQETNVQWYIVEQEQYKVGPMESVKDCIDHIRKIGR